MVEKNETKEIKETQYNYGKLCDNKNISDEKFIINMSVARICKGENDDRVILVLETEPFETHIDITPIIKDLKKELEIK